MNIALLLAEIKLMVKIAVRPETVDGVIPGGADEFNGKSGKCILEHDVFRAKIIALNSISFSDGFHFLLIANSATDRSEPTRSLQLLHTFF